MFLLLCLYDFVFNALLSVRISCPFMCVYHIYKCKKTAVYTQVNGE